MPTIPGQDEGWRSVPPYRTLLGDRADRIIDRIVDGGYFENGGVSTALELAKALRDEKLRPVILQLTNDPISPERMRQLDADPNSDPLLPERNDRQWAAGLVLPFLALYNTRSARADLVVIGASEAAKHAAEMTPVAHVTVYGQRVRPNDGTTSREGAVPFRDVSMSWWLSKPMQEFIDSQISNGEQAKMLHRVCSWLGKPGDTTGLVQRCSAGVERARQRQP